MNSFKLKEFNTGDELLIKEDDREYLVTVIRANKGGKYYTYIVLYPNGDEILMTQSYLNSVLVE